MRSSRAGGSRSSAELLAELRGVQVCLWCGCGCGCGYAFGVGVGVDGGVGVGVRVCLVRMWVLVVLCECGCLCANVCLPMCACVQCVFTNVCLCANVCLPPYACMYACACVHTRELWAWQVLSRSIQTNSIR